MSEVVIELSIDETNQLRQQLGLAPLRVENHHHDHIAATTALPTGTNTSTTTTSRSAHTTTQNENNADGNTVSNVAWAPSSLNNCDSNKEFLELSFDETNKLRLELGLAPLKLDSSIVTSSNDLGSTLAEDRGTSMTIAQHVPAVNEGERHEIAERIERAKLKRQVEENIKTQFASPALGVDDETYQNQNPTKSWAQRMRATRSDSSNVKSTTTISSLPKRNTNSSGNHKNNSTTAATTSSVYQEQDLHGLRVGHSISELEDGSTTILTLKDTPLLQTAEEDTTTTSSKKIIGLTDADEVELQNVQLVQQQQVQDGLREKRKIEMGFGRSGGYVGFDDDEFEELGGTQGPSRLARSTIVGMNATSITTSSSHGGATKKRKKGFHIGKMLEEQDADMESDIVTAIQKGKAISLAESGTNVDVRPSDYMTPEEFKAMEEEQKQQRKSKKSKKSHKVKDKKKHKRRTNNDDSEEDDNDVVGEQDNNQSNSKTKNANLLDELDATAVDGPPRTLIRKKRNRNDNDDDDDDDDDEIHTEDNNNNNNNNNSNGHPKSNGAHSVITKSESLSSKRKRYEQVMAKGNLRSLTVFATSAAKKSVDDLIDEEPDDAFLNAALEKARRLNRLKAMQLSSNNQTGAKGAEAVVTAIQQANQNSGTLSATTNDSKPIGSDNSNKTIVFKIDETHEFTRTLLARTEQMEREQARLANKRKNVVIKLEPKDNVAVGIDNVISGGEDTKVTMGVKQEEAVDMDVDMNELAKEVKVEDTTPQQYHIELDGTTTAVPKIGRGVGGLLQLLQQSGDLQNGTNDKKKEEMRGRAKDKRTYEDYEPLDLSKVVRIDERNATEKDKEFASREVKLEYRDEHGRLLTRKEAFRDLSYQFHGYGSGKRKQEKKLQQIAREQAEARIVSQQLSEGAVHTTFGALKETQRATGKAFVIHKTGT